MMPRPAAVRSIAPAVPDDDALLCAIRDGRQDALDALYVRHAEGLFASAWRLLGDASEAEDAVHDLFADLPSLLKNFTPQGHGLGWLRTCVRRLALMRLRQLRRRPTDGLESAGHVAHGPETASAADDAALAWRLLDKLPVTLRAVVTLRMMDDCTHAEIASLLGISEAASQMRLSRGMQALRAMLTEDAR